MLDYALSLSLCLLITLLFWQLCKIGKGFWLCAQGEGLTYSSPMERVTIDN